MSRGAGRTGSHASLMSFDVLAIEAKTVVCRRECRMLNEATNSVEAATHGDRVSRFRGDLSLLT